MLFPLNVTIESDHEGNFNENDGVIETTDSQQSYTSFNEGQFGNEITFQ